MSQGPGSFLRVEVLSRGHFSLPRFDLMMEEGRDELGILIESLLSWKSCTKSREPREQRVKVESGEGVSDPSILAQCLVEGGAEVEETGFGIASGSVVQGSSPSLNGIVSFSIGRTPTRVGCVNYTFVVIPKDCRTPS